MHAAPEQQAALLARDDAGCLLQPSAPWCLQCASARVAADLEPLVRKEAMAFEAQRRWLSDVSFYPLLALSVQYTQGLSAGLGALGGARGPERLLLRGRPDVGP